VSLIPRTTLHSDSEHCCLVAEDAKARVLKQL
jgi:hypothetical protein